MIREDLREKFSGWSGVKCDTCGNEITKSALKYSMEKYKKPLCKTCQSLEIYHVKAKN